MSFALHFRVGVDGHDGEPVVLAVVLVHALLLDGDLAKDLVLVRCTLSLGHIDRQVAELPGNLKLEVLREEGVEGFLLGRRSEYLLLVELDGTVHVALLHRAMISRRQILRLAWETGQKRKNSRTRTRPLRRRRYNVARTILARLFVFSLLRFRVLAAPVGCFEESPLGAAATTESSIQGQNGGVTIGQLAKPHSQILATTLMNE